MKYYLTIFLLMISFNSYADLHKWIDANGKVHYSDEEPPPDVKAETLHTAPEPGIGTSASAPAAAPVKSIYEQAAEINKERKAKELASQKAAKEQQEAAIKKNNCEQARNQLLTLQNSPRIATYDENGNRSIMDDSTRQKNIDEANAAISKYCN
jgi:Domain of unknown function (DUF4124)